MIINRNRLLDDIATLAEFGAHDGGGITRRAYSPAYVEARDWLAHRMEDAGLAVRCDAVGNLIGRLGPGAGPAVLSGSHIDTVPGGGRLDGAYGVLAALECARTIHATKTGLAQALEVVAFVEEEGAFLNLLGSRAMAGEVTASEIEGAHGEDGTGLCDAMVRAGHDPARFAEAQRAPGEIAAYLELHIEQGPVLEAEALQIGIVEGIVAILGLDYDFTGEPGHAGTTPMTLRRDALKGAAAFISRAYAELAPNSAPRAA